MKLYALAAAGALILSGCTVGPNYKRPKIAVPDQFRATAASPDAPSIADTKWFEIFDDPNLRKLVDTALEQNFDLRIAAERVLQARAQFGIQRANLFPFLDGQAQWNATRSSTIGSLPFIAEDSDLKFAYTQVGVGASWELDLWGRLRRLNESAKAQYLATEENRLAVKVSLVGEVMNTYFTLLEQDLELEIGKKTREIAADGLRLTKLRLERGAASGLDVRQAEQLLYTATAQIASAERAIGQTENALSLLLGQTPESITRGAPLRQISMPSELPAGLPSSLLARRPDIRQAEHLLISANAEIGAARAQYFPQISLTALFGGQSRALTEIFTTPARVASVTPAALIPIFRAGQIRSTVRLTEAQQREAVIAYQSTIYGALRDVSDALIANEQTREQRKQQELLVEALTESTRLSQLRYEGGLDSYLQVLDAQRNLFESELVLAELRLLELQSVVRLYRSLGGGWQ
ncbi:MAG: efflux transporter outer membrane subunit [Bryobacteraceae bacterium]